MNDLVFTAFQALGPAATRREVALVAKALRETGDEEVLGLFGAGTDPEPDAAFDREACAAVTGIAERAGVGGFVALDLYTEVIRPGWSPFPTPGGRGAGHRGEFRGKGRRASLRPNKSNCGDGRPRPARRSGPRRPDGSRL